MAGPLNKIPLTPLDGLRALLREYADSDAGWRDRLASQLKTLKKQAVHELGLRLGNPAAPRGLRRAIFQAIPKFDWPEWTPWILKGLKTETDLGLFDDGCAALGAIGTRVALDALLALRNGRSDPGQATILDREIGLFQSSQPAAYHISRLLEGQSNVRMSAQGAKVLSAIATDGDLAALVEAFPGGDPQTQRLIIRLMGSMPGLVSAEFLKGLAETVREDFLDHTLLMDALNRLQPLQRASVQPELLRQLEARFAGRSDEAAAAVAAVQRNASQEGGNLLGPLEDIRPLGRGAYDAFLLDVVTLVAEGKIARYSAVVSDAAQVTEARLGLLTTQCDQVAEALAFKVDAGEVDRAEVLALFMPILRSRAGSDGFVFAFLRLLPPSETAALDELLADPDLERRGHYLDALGVREEDGFTPFFLKAMDDPIVEVGQRAIHHLGKLPSSFQALMALFDSGHPDKVRQAIRVFGENHTRMAAEPLLAFIQAEHPDALLVEATEALSAIAYPAAAPVLLELLHDGKPLALQLALAEALKGLGSAEASLGLIQRAQHLKQAPVLILALEGALAAFGSFGQPLPETVLADFLSLFDRCCDEREGEGNRLRAILALQDLYVFDQAAYEQLRDRVSDFLFAMRTKEAWDRESNDRVANVVKELTRRSEGLALLAQKESAILGQMGKLPANGPKRLDSLLALREALSDPDLIIRPELAGAVVDLVRAQLNSPGSEWRETAHLCEIVGLSRRPDLVNEVRDIYQAAAGLGLRSAAKEALLRMGLEEADLNRRAPVRSILLLEPSAFMRKKLAGSLRALDRWELVEAGSHEEAEQLLTLHTVDLVLSEVQDSAGSLAPWLERQKELGRFRHCLLSTANRDAADLTQQSWVIGVLYKPYSVEQVISALEG